MKDYDISDAKSILRYAKTLEGHTFQDVLIRYLEKHRAQFGYAHMVEDSDNFVDRFRNPRAKGELGNFLEKYFFEYNPNGKQEADFAEAGVELKQTCVDSKQDGTYSAGERLSITNISYKEPVFDNFKESHVYEKIKSILLIHYLRDRNINRMDYKFLYVNLFTPPEEDLKIIMDDYQYIINKIKEGKANELSEGDTLYLGACTKGATAAKSTVPQEYYNKDVPAKKRNFCFKRSYMDYVLKNYIQPNNNINAESVMLSDIRCSLAETINIKLSAFEGKSMVELCQLFDIPFNSRNKSMCSNVIYRMLGIKGNHAAELVKAGIKIKTIRLEKNNTLKESMPFNRFLFKDIVKENWESSSVYELFSENKFLFVVFKSDGTDYRLYKNQLWNMPIFDLENIVQHEWEQVKKQFEEGVQFSIQKWGDGVRVVNNLPSMKDTEIFHVRSKSRISAYKLQSGFEVNIDELEKVANELPNGEWATTMCYWLNHKYILKQLKLNKIIE